VAIQWSYHRSSSTGTFTHTFPLVFSSVLSIQVTPRTNDGNVGYVGVSSVTNTNYKVNIQGTVEGYDVMAVGYIN